MSSLSMESMGGEAAAVHIYRRSGAEFTEVAKLSPITPPRVVEGSVEVPQIDMEHGDGSGLYLALVQGGRVIDMAQMLFYGGDSVNDDGGSDCYSECYSTDPSTCRGSSSRSSSVMNEGYRHMFGLMGCEEDEEEEETTSSQEEGMNTNSDDSVSSENNGVSFRSIFWQQLNDDLGSNDDDEDREKSTSSQEGLKKAEEETTSSQEEGMNTNSDDSVGSENNGGFSRSIFWQQLNDDLGSNDDDEDREKSTSSQEGLKKAEEETTSSQEEGMNTNSDDLVGSENNGGFSRSIFWQQLNGDLGSNDDDEDREKNTSSQEGLKNVEEGLKKEDEQTVQMNLRLWPLQKHVLIKMFRGNEWILTKDYFLFWLNFEQMNEFDLEVDYDGPSIFRESTFVMDFEITAPYSVLHGVLDMMKPSMCNFTILKKVGGAKACRVFKCLWLGSICALKTISQQISCPAEPREIAIISSLKDRRVMTFFQAWRERWVYKGRPEQEHVFIHLEFCPRTLFHAIYGKSDWIQDRWFIFEEIMQGIKELHAKCVVHRDLKPNNIFFGSDDGVRIGDFGDACSGQDEFGRYGGGTPDLGTKYYLAPELDSGQTITEKADIYSAGVILFELFALIKTVYERNEIFPKLVEEGPSDSWEGDHELFAKMTDSEPSCRPSAAEVLVYIRQHHRL